MKTVKVGDGRGVAILVRPQVVRVQHCDKGNGHAGDGQDVEHGVEQLVPNATAAAASAIDEHS